MSRECTIEGHVRDPQDSIYGCVTCRRNNTCACSETSAEHCPIHTRAMCRSCGKAKDPNSESSCFCPSGY